MPIKKIEIKRVYDAPSINDGYRLLIDRIWPRGVSKEDAQLDEWNKDLAPSTELRKWFDHDSDKFKEFAKKYRQELQRHAEDLKELLEKTENKNITLLYGAKDTEHNQAVVLKSVIEKMR